MGNIAPTQEEAQKEAAKQTSPTVAGGQGQFGGQGPSGGVGNTGAGFGGGRITFDAAGNRIVEGHPEATQLAGIQAKNDYLANQGKANTGEIIDPVKFAAYNNSIGIVNEPIIQRRQEGLGTNPETGRPKAVTNVILNEGIGFSESGGLQTQRPNIRTPDIYKVELNEGIGFGESLSVGATHKPDLSNIKEISQKGGIITVFSDVGKIDRSQNPVFSSNEKYVGTVKASKPEESFSDLMDKGKGNVSYSVFYPQAEREVLKSVKENPKFFEGLSVNYYENLGKSGFLSEKGMSDINHIFHMQQKEENAPIKAQQKEFAQTLYQQEHPGVSFEIKDKSGKVIETTSGQRSRYDFMKAQGFGNKSKDLGPYNDVSYSPKINQTFEQLYESNTKMPEKATGSPNLPDVVSAIGKNLYAFGGQSFGFAVSTGGFALKEIESLRLEKGQIKVTDKPSQEKTTSSIMYGLTFGFKPETLVSKGTFERKESPPLTHRGEAIIKANTVPTLEGANLGFEKGNESKNYYLGASFAGGVQLGLIAEGFMGGIKSVTPIRLESFPLPYKEGVTPAKAIVFGYGGQSDFAILGGKGGGKFFKGTPKAENLNLDKLAPTISREGFESGTGRPIQNKVITEVVVPELERQGKITKTGALDILEMGKEGSTLAVNAPTIQFRGFGEKAFRNLTPEEQNVLLDLIKEKKYNITGSTSEIPFTKEGLVAQARDIDIKGVPLEKAKKTNILAAERLNAVTTPDRTFIAKDESLLLNIKEQYGTVRQEKIMEFPQREIQQGYGLSEEEKSYVFGNPLPTKKAKVSGIKVSDYNFQGLRKIASSTEFHIGEKGNIDILASSGREVKDPAHAFSFAKTKASNYLSIGKIKEGVRLNEIAENYRIRHPELDFSKEFRSVNEKGTLELEQRPSKLSILTTKSKNLKNTPSNFSKSNQIFLSNKKDLSYSIFSQESKMSNLKSLSSKSSKNISSKIPIASSMSSNSASSSKSNISRASEKSSYSIFGKSNISNKNSINSFSGINEKSVSSSKSGISGKSGSSSISSISSISVISSNSSVLSQSGKSSSSSFTTSSVVSPPYTPPYTPPPKPKIASLPKRRKYKGKEGPTKTFLLGVNNIFASSLSIKEPKRIRFK